MLSKISKFFKGEKFGSIKGKVINFYGHPIDDAEVFAKINNEIIAKSMSDDNGDFFLENIPVGTRKILIEAVKGKRDADHRDLTHRGSYGTGKDVESLIKVVRRNPNVTGVQVPLIGVPGPKVKDFLLEMIPKGKFEEDKLGRYFCILETKEKNLKLPFKVKIEPFPDIRQGKFSIYPKIVKWNKNEECVLEPKVLQKINPKLVINGNEYDWDKIPIFSLNDVQDIDVRLSNISSKEKPIKVSLEISIFQQLEKRKYVNFSTGYYKVI